MITRWEDTVPKLPLLVDKLKAMKTEIAYHRLNQCLQDKVIAELNMKLTDELTTNAKLWDKFVELSTKLQETRNELDMVTKEHLELIDDYAELRMEK